jgi:hypothetical protein
MEAVDVTRMGKIVIFFYQLGYKEYAAWCHLLYQLYLNMVKFKSGGVGVFAEEHELQQVVVRQDLSVWWQKITMLTLDFFYIISQMFFDSCLFKLEKFNSQLKMILLILR